MDCGGPLKIPDANKVVSFNGFFKWKWCRKSMTVRGFDLPLSRPGINRPLADKPDDLIGRCHANVDFFDNPD